MKTFRAASVAHIFYSLNVFLFIPTTLHRLISGYFPCVFNEGYFLTFLLHKIRIQFLILPKLSYIYLNVAFFKK